MWELRDGVHEVAGDHLHAILAKKGVLLMQFMS